MESNQAKEIFDYIKENPNASTEDIARGAGWNRHVVEVAIKLMIEQGLIEETGRTEWGDLTFRAKAQDPQTPDQWQEAVDYAYVLIQLVTARQYGLVTGGPEADVARCEDLLARGRERGVTPSPDAVERLLKPVEEEGE